jgi:hypothetical protein
MLEWAKDNYFFVNKKVRKYAKIGTIFRRQLL